MTEQSAIGTPHTDPPEADVFTGTVPAADVGEPDDLGQPVGQPGDPEGR